MSATTSKLDDLIAEERRAFHAYDADNGRSIHVLRAKILATSCASMGDVLTKGRWVQQLFTDAGETLDDAIAAAKSKPVMVAEQQLPFDGARSKN